MQIVIVKKALKALDKLPPNIRKKIRLKILTLKNNPINPQTVKLTEQPGYRLRVGDYRILYLLDIKADKIVISRVKHRKDVYRNM